MKFLKTFENYDPTENTQDELQQSAPNLRGKNTITEFELGSEMEDPTDLEEEDYIEGEDVMPQGVRPLGESLLSRKASSRAPEKKSREEIMKIIRQKAASARRRKMLTNKPQD